MTHCCYCRTTSPTPGGDSDSTEQLFQWLRYPRCGTERFRRSFFPSAGRLYNKDLADDHTCRHTQTALGSSFSNTLLHPQNAGERFEVFPYSVSKMYNSSECTHVETHVQTLRSVRIFAIFNMLLTSNRCTMKDSVLMLQVYCSIVTYIYIYIVHLSKLYLSLYFFYLV